MAPRMSNSWSDASDQLKAEAREVAGIYPVIRTLAVP
jgi:hypothetical protein